MRKSLLSQSLQFFARPRYISTQPLSHCLGIIKKAPSSEFHSRTPQEDYTLIRNKIRKDIDQLLSKPNYGTTFWDDYKKKNPWVELTDNVNHQLNELFKTQGCNLRSITADVHSISFLDRNLSIDPLLLVTQLKKAGIKTGMAYGLAAIFEPLETVTLKLDKYLNQQSHQPTLTK